MGNRDVGFLHYASNINNGSDGHQFFSLMSTNRSSYRRGASRLAKFIRRDSPFGGPPLRVADID